jgi:hypothetical protein
LPLIRRGRRRIRAGRAGSGEHRAARGRRHGPTPVRVALAAGGTRATGRREPGDPGSPGARPTLQGASRGRIELITYRYIRSGTYRAFPHMGGGRVRLATFCPWCASVCRDGLLSRWPALRAAVPTVVQFWNVPEGTVPCHDPDGSAEGNHCRPAAGLPRPNGSGGISPGCRAAALPPARGWGVARP